MIDAKRYKKISDLVDAYGISRDTCYRLVREIQASGRYPPYAVIGERSLRRVDERAFQDYYANMTWLRHPNMKKYVKPYKEGE